MSANPTTSISSRSILLIALLAGFVCAGTATLLAWQAAGYSFAAGFRVLSAIPVALPALTAACFASLAALAIGWRKCAIAIAALVAAFVTLTIVAWVFDFPLAFSLSYPHSTTTAEAEWPAGFPNASAVRSVTILMLTSLSLLLLALRPAIVPMRSVAWAIGFSLTVGPPMRIAMGLSLPVFREAAAPNFVDRAAALGTPPVSLLLSFAALVLLGVSMLGYLRSNAGSGPIEWNARIRALIIAMVVAFTLSLWHMVRSAEVRQLRSDIDTALEEIVRDLRGGLAAHANAINRLGAHFASVGWQPTESTFRTNAAGFLSDYPAANVVAITNADGEVMQAARRIIGIVPASAAGPSADTHTVELIPRAAFATAEFSPAIAAGRIEAALQAFASKQPIRGVALDRRQSPIESPYLSAFPVFGADDLPIGAVIIVYHTDVGLAQILRDSAPEFGIRIQLDDVVGFQRSPSNDTAVPRYRVTSRGANASSTYAYEIEPGMALVNRTLTWTPSLVLLFAWGSLGLLTFALYNERRAQALARERNHMLDQSLDVICLLDAEGRYVSVNQAAHRVLGYSPAELIGKHFHAVAHPDELPLLRSYWREAQDGAPPPVAPLRFRHRDGRTLYLQGNAHWQADQQLFYCDMRDVTEQHALELARAHAAETFQIGVEQAGCVVYEYLADSKQLEWVGAVQALTGHEPGALSRIGFDGWLAMIHPEERPHVEQVLRRCLETRQPHTIDYRVRHRDGHFVPVLDRGRSIGDSISGEQRLIGALIDLTSIRRQEHALRRSEERYRIIATQVGAVIIEREIATNRLLAYGPVEQIFGYSKEQVESRPVSLNDVMIHPDDRERVMSAVRQAQESLSNYYIEYRRRHRGGHYIHVAARAAILAGPDGRAERAITAYTDITERKQAEARLSESEERFRQAAEQARQIVYEYTLGDNLEVTQVRVAGDIEGVLGYTPEAMRHSQNADRFSLIHPDDIPHVRSAGGTRSNSQFNVEHRLRHRDGHYVHVENRGAIKRDIGGNIVGIVGMLLDISERRSAEADRLRYTAQLRMLADIARRVSTFLSLHELLNHVAKSMRDLLGTNAAAASVTHVTPAAVHAVSYADHYGAQRAEPKPFGTADLHAQLADGPAPVRLTVDQTATDPRWSGLTQNDELRHPLRGWLGVSLTTRDGASLGHLELTDKCDGDFTDSDAQILNQLAGVASVAIENILLYATLEERVAARTRELEISNRELEAFSYSVSHDLRAPLRAIAGFSSILENEYAHRLDAVARRYLQRITGGVERMANLIDDLLSLARVSRLDIKREAIDLTTLCRTIARRQQERCVERDIDIKIDPRMRTIADPRLVEVALENLVENAIKFTGTRNAGRIHIGRRVIDGRPAFFVQDNGVGFDPQYASNLFGVFQRLHSATEFPGTGVGLATVQRIVQRHHGRVWAESQIDQGAVFYFTFESEV